MDPLLEPEPPAFAGQYSWIDRVRAADADAERAWQALVSPSVMIDPTDAEMSAAALITIAAELRAARIARRPGAGQ